MSELVTLKVEVCLPAKRVGDKPEVRPAQWATHLIILCSAKPRSIMGVNGVRSDMKSSACQSRQLKKLTHLLVHEPECQRLVSYESLVVTLSICDTAL